VQVQVQSTAGMDVTGTVAAVVKGALFGATYYADVGMVTGTKTANNEDERPRAQQDCGKSVEIGQSRAGGYGARIRLPRGEGEPWW
jgi:hypothetical protein